MTAPIRVGILHDMSDSIDRGPVARRRHGRVHAARRSTTSSQRGRLDREVEFVHAAGLGLPAGTAFAIEQAFAELVAQGVLMIVGPAVGDNALVATPLADAARVPTINWAGTERARSEFMFHLQVGSHEDETVLLARHVASLGAQRVGVVFDRSPIGRRYAALLRSRMRGRRSRPRGTGLDRTAGRGRDRGAGGRASGRRRCSRVPRARARRHRGRLGRAPKPGGTRRPR